MKIANFMVQHELSPEQISAGLYNPNMTNEEKDILKKLMLVDSNTDKIYPQALELFDFIVRILKRENVNDFHIMGQANLMLCLYKIKFIETTFIDERYGMWESTTERVSQEVKNPDGTTTKTNVFKFVKLRKYGR